MDSQHIEKERYVHYGSYSTLVAYGLTGANNILAYYIAFGPHGPRALPPPGETKKIFFGIVVGILASGTLFGFTRMFAGPPPKTMTKEYQEASEEFLRVCPIFEQHSY